MGLKTIEFTDTGARDIAYIALHPEVLEHVARATLTSLPETFEDLYSQVTQGIDDKDGVRTAVRAILNLHRLQQKNLISATDVFDQVTAAVDRKGLKDWESARQSWLSNKVRIVGVMESISDKHPIVLLQKSSELTYAYENVLHEARIITDVRPVFKTDANEVLRAVIVHKLFIEYTGGGARKRIEFALDATDVADLRKMCQRADQKAQILKNAMKAIDWETVIPGGDG